MNKYQVGYYKDGEEWIKTVSAASEEEAIKQVKNEIPDAEIKDVNQVFEEYRFEEPDENRDKIDLTTDRFEPNASYWDWGEFTEEGKKLESKLYEILKDKELYPDDITVKEKDGVTKVYIDIGGDWKHEHLYLNHVMTDELGYMELSQKTLPDDFYDDGGDSYRAMHVYVMFPDLVRFNKLNGLYSSKGEMNMGTEEQLAKIYGELEEMIDVQVYSHELRDDLIDAAKAVRKARETAYRVLTRGQPDKYGMTIGSSKKPIKSGYYDDPVNHPEGGGTCDYCGSEIAPGDGYESDFASSQDTAARYLFLALGGDENYAYRVVENWHNFVQWLQGADEDIDEDWLQDAVNDICRMAFGNSDGYMCSTCLDKTIKEAAEKWVEENW